MKWRKYPEERPAPLEYIIASLEVGPDCGTCVMQYGYISYAEDKFIDDTCCANESPIEDLKYWIYRDELEATIPKDNDDL